MLVSYNPQQNQVSISNPVNQSRYALVCKSAAACQIDPLITSQVTLAGTGPACVTIPVGSACTNGGQPPNELSLFGGLAVDPATNQAFVVQSGSSTIQIVDSRTDFFNQIENRSKSPNSRCPPFLARRSSVESLEPPCRKGL